MPEDIKNNMLLVHAQAEYLTGLMLENNQLQGFCSSLCTDPQSNLQLLQQMFTVLTALVQREVALSALQPPITCATEDADAVSHIKQRLLDIPVSPGQLTFEVMYFTGLAWTKPHLHPEYVVDEIITGRLQEHLYRVHQDGTYSGIKNRIRTAGDRRAIYDPEGFPHNVTGTESDPCIMLTLCLGTRAVAPISIPSGLDSDSYPGHSGW